MRIRYAATLSAQVFRMLVSAITATIVPRALGPAMFGNYNFLLATSVAIRAFLDNGTQQAFFTFSSQERSSGSLTRVYAIVIACQFAMALALVGIATFTGTVDWLWHGQRPDQILLVTTLDWAMFLALSLQQLGDSKGQTSYLQLIGAAVSFLTLIGLLALRFAGVLDFNTFVLLNLAGALVSCGALAHRLFARNSAQFWAGVLEFRRYAQRWWRFTKPLISLQYYLAVVTYLGTYLIQRWYGSAEQGYYALALQWSSFAMVFTTSGVWIFWREIAHLSAAGDLNRTAGTYEQFSGLFFFLALVLSCGLSAASTTLVEVVAGDRFRAASSVLAIMAFYPLSQTINQLSIASMKATERTESYARWTILLSVPDLLLAYMLLAPLTAPVPGLHLGANGMAIKTALYGLVTAQLYDFINCRFLKISYIRALKKKLTAFMTVGGAAILSLTVGTRWLQQLGLPAIGALAVAAFVYCLAVAAIVLLYPGVASLTRVQISQGLRLLQWR